MAYSPSEAEEKWTRFWFERKLFKVTNDPDRPAFSIALPPPNVTGNLHLGHALNGTLQDILIRAKRMQGYNVLWQPGTDHASISTHMVVERELRKEGKTRHQIGREAFEERVWEWCRKYGAQILNQYRRLGVSFGWDRIAFTMDDSYVKAVNKAFVTLFKDGLIYRGNRVTNWCPQCRTSISDLEVEHQETEGSLYFTKYFLDDGSGIADNSGHVGHAAGTGHIIVATTRPETMFGDVAVAVHPNDKRYKHLVGKSVRIPVTGRSIPIIADSYVDMEFGSGALKITSAHDVNDWDVSRRHNLPLIAVIDERGMMSANDYVPVPYQGKERFEARAQLLDEMQEKGLLEEVKAYTHGVAHCERCHTIIEYLPSDQWFVRMKELAQPAIRVVEEGCITFVPERYTSMYLNWLQSIRDWCISRQLWFGQRIPVWTCKKCGMVDAFEIAPDACTKCGANAPEWEQDPDVLDTWFSSSLWPFATLGWPEDTPEMRTFYPTNVLSTAREIIYLWVARMVFMSMKLCKTIPFKQVLIHPIIQTSDGKRMSKSKGNVIDPLDMIDKYGADANRFWYTSLGVKGDQDVRFRQDRLEEYKRFVNKLWNAGRFVLSELNTSSESSADEGERVRKKSTEAQDPRSSFPLTLPDRWILHRFDCLVEAAYAALRNYDFDDLCRQTYEFVWDDFCDWYLEIAKVQSAKEQTRPQTQFVLQFVFESLMRLLHPIMPFITEELWQQIPRAPELAALESIMFAPFPCPNPQHRDESVVADMELLMRTIRAIRNIRQTYNVSTSANVTAMVACKDNNELSCLTKNEEYVRHLARISELTIAKEISVPPLTASEPVFSSTIYLPLSSLIDTQKSKNKLVQRRQAVEKEAARISEILETGEFKRKAPKDRVQSLESQLTELSGQLQSIHSQLEVLERT